MSRTARWTLVVVLLVPAIVLPLLVGVYDRNDPELWGFPFYFWFQFLLVIWAAIMTSIAFVISKEATRRDRAARAEQKGGTL